MYDAPEPPDLTGGVLAKDAYAFELGWRAGRVAEKAALRARLDAAANDEPGPWHPEDTEAELWAYLDG